MSKHLLNYNRFEYTFWVDATNKDTIEQSYKLIASRISRLSNGFDENSSLETALQRLENFDHEWLLLFDGADNLHTITNLFPPGTQGNILYTSRNYMLRPLPSQQIYKVDEMTEREAIDLLLKSARQEDVLETLKDIAIPIVKELGFLALAIDQAGAYIAGGQCDMRAFLATFKRHRHELLTKEAYKGASVYERAVYATWDLSYNAIEILSKKNSSNANDARHAIQILNIFAFWHYENIMEDIFKKGAENLNYAHQSSREIDPRGELDRGAFLPKELLQLDFTGKWEDFSFRQGVRILREYSLINRDESGQCFSMHRLVHGWAYDRLSEKDKRNYLRTAHSTLAGSISWRPEDYDYTFWRNLLPHVTACQKHSALLLENDISLEEEDCFGFVLSNAGHWKEAEEIRSKVVAMRRKLLGAEHLGTLTAMYNLASIHVNLGQLTKAEHLLVPLVRICKDVLGMRGPETLSSMNNLAAIYGKQGKYEKAEELHSQVLETCRDVLGKRHPDTLISMNNLARVWKQQNFEDRALQLMSETVELSKQVMVVDHPDTIARMEALDAWLSESSLKSQAMDTVNESG